jgi:hypothetical protein
MYVGPLETGADPRCIVEADSAAGVRAILARVADDAQVKRAIHRPATYRNDLKPARISSLRNFGCSNAAKCPPFGSLL